MITLPGLFAGVAAVLPRVMKPLPNGAVVAVLPPLPLVMVPSPNFEVVVVPP